MSTLEITLALDGSGNVDVQSSLQNAESAILTYKAERETEEETIRTKLDEVFDTRPGVKMNMPFVINQALTLMGVSQAPASYKTLYDRVHDFIVVNSQGKTDKETKLVERPDSYFVIGKGKGGGVARRADLDAAEAAKLAQS
jgi:hypothetical protein